MAHVILKATLGEETHRVSLNAPFSFASVRTSIAGFFPQLPSFRITYKDEDGDLITVATDADINEAIRFFGKQPLKFTIIASDTKTAVVGSAEPVKAATPAPAPAPQPTPAPQPAATNPPVYSVLGAARAAAEQAPTPAQSPFRLQARFVRDVTVPDGSVFVPDAAFRKTWCIRNAGDFAWPSGCVLRFEAGDQLSGVSAPVPIVQADAEVELSVNFRCPLKEGKFVSYWRLCNADGTVFGDRIWTEIKVEKAAAPAPAPVQAPVVSAPIVVPFPVAPATQPPLAPLPSPPAVQFAFAYQPALDQLKVMGFADNERTRRLLVKNRGDVNRTSQELLDSP